MGTLSWSEDRHVILGHDKSSVFWWLNVSTASVKGVFFSCFVFLISPIEFYE